MNDEDDEEYGYEETIEIVTRELQSNEDWIKSITNNSNLIRKAQIRNQWKWVWVNLGVTTLGVIASWATEVPLFWCPWIAFWGFTIHTSAKRNRDAWDDMLLENERAILRAIDRRESWENFLKEYRGY